MKYIIERPTSIWEARVQAPSKPEFFSGFFFCNFFNCSLPPRINSLPMYILHVYSKLIYLHPPIKEGYLSLPAEGFNHSPEIEPALIVRLLSNFAYYLFILSELKILK